MDLKIHFHKILFILVIASELTGSEAAKPVLNVPDEIVIYSSESNKVPLEITCHGSERLIWETKVDKNFTHIAEKYLPAGAGYASTLTISEPYPQDTGYFTCRYATSGEYVTTYVYVFDNQTAFVNENSNGNTLELQVNQGDDIILDCRTTHPSIVVNVTKANSVVSKHQMRFDPKTGVTLPGYLNKDAIGKKFICIDSFSHSEIHTIVNYKIETSNLHQPAIEKFHNSHYAVGHSFQLNCSIPVTENNNQQLTFIWKTPSVHNIEQMVYTKQNSAGKTLKVIDAQKADSGVYTCQVSYGSEVKAVTETIEIADTIEPFVHFEKRKYGPLSVMEHEQFNWHLYFRGFPDNINYVFLNRFNKTFAKSRPEVLTDFDYNDGKLSLRINNIRAEDFGHYSAVISVEGLNDTAYTTVIVNATPKIEFLNFPDYFIKLKPLTLRAKVLAYDWIQKEPNVTWWFNDNCPAGYGSCEDPKTGIQLSSTSLTKHFINQFETRLNFTANSSGVIESGIENGFGKNSTISYVILSDIGGKLIFKATIESKNMTIKKATKMDIVEGDYITLTCIALDFIYEGLTFNNTSVESGLLMTNCSTTLATGSCLNGKISMAMKGSYECKAKNRKSGKMEVTTLNINVVDQQKPSLDYERSNVTLEGTTVIVKQLKPFHISCYVNGMPTPTITWFKDGIKIEDISDLVNEFEKRENNHVLEFKFAQKLHSGKYSCKVENRLGSIEPSIEIEVESMGLSTLHRSLIIIAAICITVLCSTIGYLIHRVKKEKKFRRLLHLNKKYLFEKGNIDNLNPDCTVGEQAVLLPYDERFEVTKDRIKFGKLLGSGAFGRVMEAKVYGLVEEGRSKRVAVKMCKDGSDATQLHALTLELKIMVHIGKHLNIVNLIGANTTNLDKGELWILVEYCRYGNLLKFIQKFKSRFVNQIDQETGLIDPERQSNLFHDMLSPSSIGRNSYGFSDVATGSLDPQGRFGSMKSSNHYPFGVRHPTVSSHSGSVSGSSSRPGMYMGNPNYVTASFSQQSSVDSSKGGDNTLNCTGTAPRSVTAAQFPTKKNLSPKISDSTLSSEDDFNKTLTIDKTVHMAPSPFSPTSEAGDFSFDSRTLSSESGEIPGVNAPFTTSDLICWSWQVSNGMEYLAKRKVLHGDLAARNLLLAEHNVVKISDFGLSRDMYKNDVYMKKGDDCMPIKWMAPEAIQQKIFSTQSDVWAFGITIWELFTLGKTPYPGVPLDPNFTASLENGMRNERPKFATDQLYQLMLKCWSGDPNERPNFCQLSEILSDLLSPDSREDYVAMNDVYMIKNEEWMGSREDYFKSMTSPDFANFQKSQIDYTEGAEGGAGYINMSVFTATPELWKERSNDGVPPKGYLDMRSVQKRSSPPPSASLFSPRPSQSSGNIFDFSGTETDKKSTPETSHLAKSEDKSGGSTLSVKTEEQTHNNTPITATSDQSINNNNQLDSSQREYNNIKNVVPKSKDNISKDDEFDDDDESKIAYVNMSKISESPSTTALTTDSTYVNSGLV